MDRVYERISNWLGPLRGRIMVGFVLIVGLYFVLSFGEQAWRARELEEEVAQRQAEITELETRRSNIQDQISTYNTDQYDTYVAQIARRDLNLAYPGETVMLVRWGEPPAETSVEEPEPEPDETETNWQKWLDFLTRRG
jgi:cell division protein FtsB